ncbi:MAG: hypothetical protein JO164_07265 [Candidatus Eremiobacteraeota bacterium]|nr:hypothetical protein [Candidatus Eremiobacteraeota bacterium]
MRQRTFDLGRDRLDRKRTVAVKLALRKVQRPRDAARVLAVQVAAVDDLLQRRVAGERRVDRGEQRLSVVRGPVAAAQRRHRRLLAQDMRMPHPPEQRADSRIRPRHTANLDAERPGYCLPVGNTA